MIERRKCNNFFADSLEDGCQFKEACSNGEFAAILARIAIHRGGCWNEAGDACGGAAAYYEAALSSLSLDVLDRESPITESARIINTPEGEAPIEIRESLVGLSFPVRDVLQPEAIRGSHTSINTIDFKLALLKDGKFDAARWFDLAQEQAVEDGRHILSWYFNNDEVQASEVKRRVSSAGRYGGHAFTKTGLGTMWSGNILPLELFTPSSSDGEKFYEALQQMADKEMDGNLQATLARYITSRVVDGMLISIIQRGDGRTTSHREEADGSHTITGIIDPGGRVTYDLEKDIDFRDNPEEAPLPDPVFYRQVDDLIAGSGSTSLDSHEVSVSLE